MLKSRLRAFTKCLSSSILLLSGFCAAQVKEIPLGIVLVQTVGVERGGSSKMTAGIVVRFVNKATRMEMFVISNDVGFAEVPLRPGTYCYDAYSSKGKGLTMKRPEKERCFEVKMSEDVEVGVEYLK